MPDKTRPFRRRYPQELRERAVRMVVESLDHGVGLGSTRRVSQQLGIGYESLRKWVKQAEVDGGRRPDHHGGAATDAELERGNRELRRANEILKSASGFPRAGARPVVAELTHELLAGLRHRWLSSIAGHLPSDPNYRPKAKYEGRTLTAPVSSRIAACRSPPQTSASRDIS